MNLKDVDSSILVNELKRRGGFNIFVDTKKEDFFKKKSAKKGLVLVKKKHGDIQVSYYDRSFGKNEIRNFFVTPSVIPAEEDDVEYVLSEINFFYES